MKEREKRRQFPLRGEEIDRFSEDLEGFLTEKDIERQNLLRIRLSMEEALLRMRDHFGEETLVEGGFGVHFGRPYVEIVLEGDVYNPLSKTESEIEDWSGSLLTAVGMTPQFSYTNRKNILRLVLPKQGLNPVLKLFVAVAAGILVGILGNVLIADSLQASVTDLGLQPLFKAWNNILFTAAGPVILLMVVTTIINTGMMTEQGGSASRVLLRYLSLSVLACALSIALMVLIFRVGKLGGDMGSETVADVFRRILSIFPDNLFTPLITANTPQILLIAVIVGNALLILGTRASALNRLIRQMNMVGLFLADWISRAVPYVAFAFVVLEIWQRKIALLKGIWQPFFSSLLLSLGFMGVILLYVSKKEKLSPGFLLGKIKDPFITACRKGSLDAAFGQTEQSCIYKLGIERHYTNVSLPHGLVLYMPISAIGTLIFTVYAGIQYNVEFTYFWFGVAIVLSVILFVATPPVPGANLLAYAAIFANLGIPSGALIDAMIFDILFGIFAAASNQLLLQLELVLQSDKLGLLDRKLLEK